MKANTILVVDDERNIRRSLEMILEGEGYKVTCASSGEEALDALKETDFQAALLDIFMPGLNGIDALKLMRESRPDLAVIVISGHGTVQDAVRATRFGAYDFLEKPLSREKVLLAVTHAIEAVGLTKENRTLKKRIEGSFEMIGESEALSSIREQIDRVAPSNGRVLILGESGTGKELIARAIHTNSKRSSGPFIKVNCAAIPEELIESELFGSDKGAFTGAVKTRDGKFLQADGGTLFLDEIGDMSLSVQAKVLRALEQGEFERVGGAETIKVDVRVLAATNKDLESQVSKGEFREDLFFRLNVVPVTAPPLRERSGDVSKLVDYFLKLYAESNDFRPKVVAPEAMAILRDYSWPGNIRELKNLTERLSIMVQGETIELSDLPRLEGREMVAKLDSSGSGSLPKISLGLTLRELREDVERGYIAQALDACGGNVTQAAKTLGIERTNLHKKIKYYELER
jgi:two-component system nitrogen regulation response regulator NtrX